MRRQRRDREQPHSSPGDLGVCARSTRFCAIVLGWWLLPQPTWAQDNPTSAVQVPVRPQGTEAGATMPALPAAPLATEPPPAPTPRASEKAPTSTDTSAPPPSNSSAPPAAVVSVEPTTQPIAVRPRDELNVAGYMPGYRRYPSLGMSPHAPRVGASVVGTTPAFGAPNRYDDWTFKWSGFMTISLQTSVDQRPHVLDGQSKTVFHSPPATIDDYASFVSTATTPGNWVGMWFAYGNSHVTAITSIDTWNPSRPTTYYQLGSQYFINNAYLAIEPHTIAGVRLKWNVGMLTANYGLLGQYGGGVYVNPIAGLIRGIGETVSASRNLSDKWVLNLEHGIMTNRNGRAPDGVIASPANGWTRSTWPASWIHHAHAGVTYRGDTEYQLTLHYLTNWAQDERVQMDEDNPVTREMNETDIPDGRVTAYAFDARAINSFYGMLSVGGAYIDATASFPVKGLTTYGGEGEQLTDRWWGIPSTGTGKLLVLAANYSMSIAKLVLAPESFGGDAPDIVINAGVHVARSGTKYRPFDGRYRHKYALDALYTMFRNVGVGMRFDRVVPNSKDSNETFHVLATRVQFKTDWTSREAIQLIYAKWFYGSHTRNEGTGERTPERLDDQLLALNYNMWW